MDDPVILSTVGNIRVFCRCRPPSQRELTISEEGSVICVNFPGETEVRESLDNPAVRPGIMPEVRGSEASRRLHLYS
jgi:hypothetical protein